MEKQLQKFYDDLAKERFLTIELLVKYASLPRTMDSQAVKDMREKFIELRSMVPLLVSANKCGVCIHVGIVQIHHIIPISCGGDNRPFNLVPLCEDCHAKVHPWLQKQIDTLNTELYGILIQYGSAYKALQKDVMETDYGMRVAKLRRDTVSAITGLLDY